MITQSLRGIFLEDAQFTFSLAVGITQAHVGLAVTIDTSAPTQVKLAGSGDFIIGRLQTVENRTQAGVNVGAVALQFSDTLPIDIGAVFAIGDTAVGSAAGKVKPLQVGGVSAPDYRNNFVSEINTALGYVVVVKGF